MIFDGRYFNVLAFKWFLNRLNPRSMEKVMVILPKLCRMNQN